MSKSPGTEGNLFPTELKDAKTELSKLPPLYSQKTDQDIADTNSSNNIMSINNINNDINKDNTDTNIENDESNFSNDNNDNDGSSIRSYNSNNSNNDENENNNEENDDNNQGTKDEQSPGENKEETKIGDDETKTGDEETKIGDEETDGVLQEQTSIIAGAIIDGENIINPNDKSSPTTILESKDRSNTNSQNPSNSASQKNSAKNTTTNSVSNTGRSLNRSSLTSHSYSASQNSKKTAIISRRVGKLPPTRVSYNQEMSKIPKNILHNPYVTKRLNIFPARNTNPPKAALSHVDYRNRTIPQKDELTEKILNGEEPEEEPTIEQLQNSANILRIIEKDLIDKSEYLEAKKVAEAFQKTLDKIKTKSTSSEVKTGLEDLIAKRNELMILADDRKQEWDDAISKYQSNIEAHVRDMKEHHKEKIEQFNSEIPSELTPLFKRNSVCYLTMRSNEKNLALNRHFDEAQKIKIKADEIEEMEREENFSKMDEYYRRKREKIKQLQQLEIVNYLSYADTRKSELIYQKEKSISAPLLRAENINKEIKRICEKRGIKQSQLNFDLVDDERVKLIKSKENENDEIFQRSRGNSSDKKPKKLSKKSAKKNEETKEEENENKEEEENNENKEEEEEGKIENNEEENVDDSNAEESVDDGDKKDEESNQ